MPPKKAVSPKKTPASATSDGASPAATSPKAASSPGKKVIVKKVVKKATSPKAATAPPSAPSPEGPSADTKEQQAPTPPAAPTAAKAKKLVKRVASPSSAAAASAPAPAEASGIEGEDSTLPSSPASSPQPKAPGKMLGKKLIKKVMPKPSGAASPSSPPAVIEGGDGGIVLDDDLMLEDSVAASPSATAPKMMPGKKALTVAKPDRVSQMNLFITEVPLHVTGEAQHEVVDQQSLLASGLDGKALEHKIRAEGLKKTIFDFYSVVAPDRASKVGDVVSKYLGDELRLFAQLEAKYRYGATDKEKRRRSAVTGTGLMMSSSMAVSPTNSSNAAAANSAPMPVYPSGYLQKEFHKNITAVAIATACRDQLVANKLREQRMLMNKAKAAATAAAAANKPSPAMPKQKTKEAITREIEQVVEGMPTDAQVAELVRLAAAPLEPKAAGGTPTTPAAALPTLSLTTPSALTQSLYGLSVWADVSVRTYALGRLEAEWDAKVVALLRKRVEEALGWDVRPPQAPLTASFALTNASESVLNDPLLDGDSFGRTGGIVPSSSSAPQAANDVLGLLEGGGGDALMNAYKAMPTAQQQDDTLLWQLIHEHHQRVRRSLFNGEVVMDEVLPTGEAAVKAASSAPPTVPASVLHACIGAGYASTCDVTYRQQVQAFVMKYCPQNLPLVMPALWLYRGREHELISKLHAEHGLDKPPPQPPAVGPDGKPLPPPKQPPTAPTAAQQQDYLHTAPNTVNSFADPLVGSEVYLSEVMHGAVCGIGREVEFDTRFKLMKDGLAVEQKLKDAKLRKSDAGAGGATAAVPPCAYPCEDASFRSWSNIPPSLHPTAHMARHFGLGPQFVHQLHAQNPLNPDACGFELLCALFPDAVYFCLDDDEQRVAFMAKRVSELMSYVQTCDPTYTRPHKGLPEGSQGMGLQASIAEAIPQLFQKYSGLKDTPTDEQYEKQAELDRIASSKVGSKFIRKPSKTFQGGTSSFLIGDDDDDDDEGGGAGGHGYRNRPERALADVFAQHFGKQLMSCDHAAFPWEDMYRHVNKERHQQVLDHCLRWSRAYGPLPPTNAIQLDIIGTATAATLLRSENNNTSDPFDLKTSTGVGTDDGDLLMLGGRQQQPPKLQPAVPDFTESSGTTRHIPSNEADPFSPSLQSIGSRDAALTPSLLHRLACQQLTRSTPTVHDSILKPWLKQTCEVGTMTRHKEEEALAKMLNMRSVGTCVAEDDIDLSDEKYKGWPVPFRYEEEYRQAVSKMSLPELRRERHRALFGGRLDPGIQLFGNKGRPLAPNPANTSSKQHLLNASPSSSRGVGGGGVRIAADGTIDLSSSPSRSPRRGHASPPPTAADVASFYKFEKDYEQWFEENIGESGRGRFDYKKQRDPDKEARRKHRAAYFGGGGDNGDDDDAFNNDDALIDEVFGGDSSQHALQTKPSRTANLGPGSQALVTAHAFKKSPYWFDHGRLEDYADVSNEALASRTDGAGVAALIGRYRKGQQMLEGARREIERLREEVDSLRRGSLLSVPQLDEVHNSRQGLHVAYPQTFNTAVAAIRHSNAGDDHATACAHCEGLQGKVNALLAKLNTLRHVNSGRDGGINSPPSKLRGTSAEREVFGSDNEFEADGVGDEMSSLGTFSVYRHAQQHHDPVSPAELIDRSPSRYTNTAFGAGGPFRENPLSLSPLRGTAFAKAASPVTAPSVSSTDDLLNLL